MQILRMSHHQGDVIGGRNGEIRFIDTARSYTECSEDRFILSLNIEQTFVLSGVSYLLPQHRHMSQFVHLTIRGDPGLITIRLSSCIVDFIFCVYDKIYA